MTRTGLKLFRVWLYAPFPGVFLTAAVLFLFDPNIDRIGLGLVFALLSLAYFCFLLVRQVERHLGHTNLRVQPTLIALGLTVFAAIGWPLALHLVYSIRPHGPDSQEDLHFNMSLMTVGIMPIVLMLVNWDDFKRAELPPPPSCDI